MAKKDTATTSAVPAEEAALRSSLSSCDASRFSHMMLEGSGACVTLILCLPSKRHSWGGGMTPHIPPLPPLRTYLFRASILAPWLLNMTKAHTTGFRVPVLSMPSMSWSSRSILAAIRSTFCPLRLFSPSVRSGLSSPASTLILSRRRSALLANCTSTRLSARARKTSATPSKGPGSPFAPKSPGGCPEPSLDAPAAAKERSRSLSKWSLTCLPVVRRGSPQTITE
mmetsp:Transcript_22326/g.56344  ORF Transcript_22326/g.56344 Transcript_22326/m.56344 type:complete len:226 (-) Transcript_22326:948-1625(-)